MLANDISKGTGGEGVVPPWYPESKSLVELAAKSALRTFEISLRKFGRFKKVC